MICFNGLSNKMKSLRNLENERKVLEATQAKLREPIVKALQEQFSSYGMVGNDVLEVGSSGTRKVGELTDYSPELADIGKQLADIDKQITSIKSILYPKKKCTEHIFKGVLCPKDYCFPDCGFASE